VYTYGTATNGAGQARSEYVSGSQWDSINANYGITSLVIPNNEDDFDLTAADKIARGPLQREILEQLTSSDGFQRRFSGWGSVVDDKRFRTMQDRLREARYILETSVRDGNMVEYTRITGFSPYMGEIINGKLS
jgi:hypothetical protein